MFQHPYSNIFLNVCLLYNFHIFDINNMCQKWGKLLHASRYDYLHVQLFFRSFGVQEFYKKMCTKRSYIFFCGKLDWWLSHFLDAGISTLSWKFRQWKLPAPHNQAHNMQWWQRKKSHKFFFLARDDFELQLLAKQRWDKNFGSLSCSWLKAL